MQNHNIHMHWWSHQLQKQDNILNLNLVKLEDTGKPESTLEISINQDIGGFHTSFENLNLTTITLTISNSESIQQSLGIQKVLEITTNHLVTNNSVEIKSAQENSFLLSTITQTVGELNPNEESVIAICVPTENSKPTIVLCLSKKKLYKWKT